MCVRPFSLIRNRIFRVKPLVSRACNPITRKSPAMTCFCSIITLQTDGASLSSEEDTATSETERAEGQGVTHSLGDTPKHNQERARHGS